MTTSHRTPGRSGYGRYGCRCDECVDAQRKAKALDRECMRADPRRRKHFRDYKRAYDRANPDSRYRDRPDQITYYRDHYHSAAGVALRQRKEGRRQKVPLQNSDKRWTPEEDAVCLRDGVTLLEICFMLGRSYDAVRRRRYRLHRGLEVE